MILLKFQNPEVGPSLTYHDQNYPEYRSGLRNMNRDNFGHDRLKMDQNLPHE